MPEQDTTFPLMGRQYELRRTDDGIDDESDADCDPPWWQGPVELRVRPTATGQRELELLLHESAHILDWHIDEEIIQQWGEQVSHLLFNVLGYRRPSE